MKTTTASGLRSDLYRELDRVVNDADTTTVVRPGGGNVVIVSEDEWNALNETLYLLSDPANATRLLQAIRDADAGETVEYDMSEFGL